MKTLEIVSGDNQFKVDETGTLIPFRFGTTEQQAFISSTDKAVFNIKNDTGLVAQVSPVLRQGGYSPCLNTADLTKLPVGIYQCELWVTNAQGLVNIYPDTGFVSFTINANAAMQEGNAIATTTIADFENQLQNYIESKMSTIQGPQGIQGPPGPQGKQGPAGANGVVAYWNNIPGSSLEFTKDGIYAIQNYSGGDSPNNIENGTLLDFSNHGKNNNGLQFITDYNNNLYYRSFNNNSNYNPWISLSQTKQGEQGPQGIQGPPGPQGPAGANGTLQYWTPTTGSSSSLEFTQDGIHPVTNYTGTDSPNGASNGTALDFSNTGANNNGLQFFTDYNNNLYYRSFNNTNTYGTWLNISQPVSVTTYSLVPCAGWQAQGSIYFIQGFGLTIWSGEAWLIPNNDINSIVSAAQFPSGFPQWKDLPLACRWSGTHTIVIESDGNGYVAPNGTIKAGTECHINFTFTTNYIT